MPGISLGTDIIHYVLMLPAAVLALALHETVKACCSTLLGDPTPKKSGRLTLNPLKYIEPIGLICAVIFRFGWGNPTPTSPLYYKDRKKGILVTYITPSLVNLLAGVAVMACIGLLDAYGGAFYTRMSLTAVSVITRVFDFMYFFAHISVATALFNIIPVYPLDASKILLAYLPPNAAVKMTQNEKVLQLALMLLMVIGVVGGIINPLTSSILTFVF
jgi:Zn-dependent protease